MVTDEGNVPELWGKVAEEFKMTFYCLATDV